MTYVGRGVDTISNVEKLDNITFDGSTTYNLTKSSAAFTPAGKNNILISINGVIQQGNFTVANATIIFDFSPTSNDTCNFIMHYGTGVLNTPADDTVSAGKLQSNSVTTAKILDANVTTAKITDANVTTGKIADDAITLAKMASGTDGNIISYDASGNPVAIATGSSGQVLTSAGAGAPPTFSTPSSFNPDASVTFNESGAAADFRVESDAITHMLYVDGGNNVCKIGGSDTYGGESLKVQKVSSTTNSAIDTLCIDAETSGTVANGFGGSIVFIGSMTGQNQVALGNLDFINQAVGGASGAFVVRCRPNGTMAERFRVASNGDLTATDTSISSNSDLRLKENISDFTYDLTKFKELKPKTFDWKNPVEHGGKSGQRGFIAQELEATDSYWVDKQLLSQYESADIDGNKVDGYTSDFDLIGADHMAYTAKLGKKDAMYVSVIKQLITKIETLETKVTALENA